LLPGFSLVDLLPGDEGMQGESYVGKDSRWDVEMLSECNLKLMSEVEVGDPEGLEVTGALEVGEVKVGFGIDVTDESMVTESTGDTGEERSSFGIFGLEHGEEGSPGGLVPREDLTELIDQPQESITVVVAGLFPFFDCLESGIHELDVRRSLGG
jgi:hypothetical protein